MRVLSSCDEAVRCEIWSRYHLLQGRDLHSRLPLRSEHGQHWVERRLTAARQVCEKRKSRRPADCMEIRVHSIIDAK